MVRFFHRHGRAVVYFFETKKGGKAIRPLCS